MTDGVTDRSFGYAHYWAIAHYHQLRPDDKPELVFFGEPPLLFSSKKKAQARLNEWREDVNKRRVARGQKPIKRFSRSQFFTTWKPTRLFVSFEEY
jgi:hypothetical protein